MGFQKGRDKTGGRKKGTPNKSTEALRNAVHALLEDQHGQILKDLKQLEPKERVNAWIRLLEYSIPKLQRSESTIDISRLSDSEVNDMIDRIIERSKDDEAGQ